MLISNLSVKSDLRERIRQTQWFDAGMQANVCLLGFVRAPDEVILSKQKMRIPNDFELRSLILDETHKSKFLVHPGSLKMYQY